MVQQTWATEFNILALHLKNFLDSAFLDSAGEQQIEQEIAAIATKPRRMYRAMNITQEIKQEIATIAANLDNASAALAMAEAGKANVMGSKEIAEGLLQMYNTANKGGLAMKARMALPPDVFDVFQDIMQAMFFNAECVIAGKQPLDRYKVLEDMNYPSRRLPAIALGLSGNTQAVPLLIKHLNDKEMGVRVNVAKALGRLKDKSAVKPLIQALRTDEAPGVRWSASEALGLLGDIQAIDALNQATKDTDSDVRKAANTALSKLQ